MTISIKRLDFTSTIDLMLCCAARHAATADGARQQALDDVTQGLNNIAALIARHKLADQLNGPVPPVPVRELPDDDEPDADALATDEPTEDLSGPALTPALQRLLRHISGNPGQSAEEICEELGIGKATFHGYITDLRKAGHPMVSKGRPARYHIGKRRGK